MTNPTLSDFLMLYPNISNCAVQYFTDDTGATDKKAGKLHMSDVSLENLRFLNKEGMGIYFSVNSMKYGERSIKSVTNLNARIVECDDLSKDAQMDLICAAPIEPSCIIESKKSYHIYYFCKEARHSYWKIICNGLADYYKGDRKIIEKSRVLRLPDFHHLKDKDDPFLVECIHLKELFYTDSQMALAFPYKQPQSVQKKRNLSVSGSNTREKIRSLGNEYMLSMLSGATLINCEKITFKKNGNGTLQIYVNDKSTSSRIDRNDMIGSHDQGGPTRIQRVRRYGRCGRKDIYQWVLNNINLDGTT